jgi:hypothetical protein
MLHPAARIRPSANQVSCPIGDEVAIFDLASGTYFGLDPLGSFIWNRLPGRVDALIDDVVAEFEVDRATASTDLLALFGDLERAGLVDIEG